MKIYTNIETFHSIESPIVTTGTFDGVHLGHLQIIKKLNQIAEKEKGETVLLTFFPHPRMVLFPDDHSLELLTTQAEKIELLEKAGIDHLIIFPFTKDFSRMKSTEFVRDVLVNKIGVKKLVIGYDHQFGRNREGSLEQLSELGPLYGFDVEEIPAQVIDDANISSTKIRNCLLKGDIEKANKYLGYNFSISGMVTEGNKLGRELGYPTANINLVDNHKIIPGNGVYAVKVFHGNEEYVGMLNVGVRPTVNSEEETREKVIEVNIFEFNKEIYNELIGIEFYNKIRNEIKFDGLDALKEQLSLDRIQTMSILSK